MYNLKICPFCGAKVSLRNLVTPTPTFYCSNLTECGAVVIFDNELCNRELGNKHKVKCWNRRAKMDGRVERFSK